MANLELARSRSFDEKASSFLTAPYLLWFLNKENEKFKSAAECNKNVGLASEY
jgi:hypothetical protein